mmetsp:Transcript_63072/g.186334  ORF Transcript_63072/g.186334 Transcript_63072/m.186334 type:complete len:636 (-) Transcript_63072:259-2166(-)|eukprot:CAMPEP_0113571752 /NCGR_PEP_ID=MMETSP0015_2-20120614/25727_1 /TAXON_ID=2838 /ORGANISM="Odontella" /LENGTH=635 /DNA_ID=CAMNT_0000474735 /DNA_START=46 /DNA_END=1953 /DNA_ORIENTATION=- /assembly_acc=CAM_ASM_000160
MVAVTAPRPVSPVPDKKAVVKAAKKALKRQDSGSMKMKKLVKAVADKIDSESNAGSDGDEGAAAGGGVCVKSVKRMIEGSDKFAVDGKTVTLAKGDKKDKKEKRKRRGEGASADEGSGNESPKKRRKKDKGEDSKSTPKSTAGEGGGSSDLSAWRKEHRVVLRGSPQPSKEEQIEADTVISGDAAYRPWDDFGRAGEGNSCVAAPLLRWCTVEKKFEKPSPIQAQSWPVLMQKGSDGKRRDMVGIAETGSGKTLAFAFPALTALYNENKNGNRGGGRGRKARMLVLAPTRELAMQSDEVIQDVGSTISLDSVVVYGGVPKHEQKSKIRRGVDCIVATPGRLKDLINEGAIDLSGVSQLVLDEADRMLDEGFEEDVRFIISQTMAKEKGRRTAMFSATWPTSVANLAAEYMVDPVRVYVGKDSVDDEGGDGGLSANKRVKQTVEVIEDREREHKLRVLLRGFYKNHQNGGKGGPRVLVFGLYKKEAERLEYGLKKEGWHCSSIHGNKAQSARTQALAEFKDGSVPILVATDVAARGLDIPNVEAVINFTFPLTIEDYIHRIGRTGRAGKTGISHTFFQPGDKSRAGELQQVLRQAGQPIPEELMKFGSTIKKKEHKMYGNFGPSSIPMKKATKIRF